MKKILLPALVLTIIALAACGNSGDKPAADTSTAQKASGADIYNRTCAACHMANGEGMGSTYPPLAKSDYLAAKDNAIAMVIKGSSAPLTVNGKPYSGTMPAQQLTDEEVAAVLTYVNKHLGNTGSEVATAEVTTVRNKLK